MISIYDANYHTQFHVVRFVVASYIAASTFMMVLEMIFGNYAMVGNTLLSLCTVSVLVM